MLFCSSQVRQVSRLVRLVWLQEKQYLDEVPATVTKISEGPASFLLGRMFYLYTCYRFIKEVNICMMRTDTPKTIAGVI